MSYTGLTDARVLHIITGLEAGGAETFLLTLLRSLPDKQNHLVVSLTGRGVIGPKLEAIGVKVLALQMGGALSIIRAPVRLLRIIREFSPKIVQTWLYHSDLLGGITAKLAGVSRVFWSVRQANLDFSHFKPSSIVVIKLCALLSYFVPDIIICNAGTAVASHAARGYSTRNTVVIPNGVDVVRFNDSQAARAKARRKLMLSADQLAIGIFARFDPQKNIAGFIDVASALVRADPRVRIVMAGAGMDQGNASLIALLSAGNVKAVTDLIGYLENPEAVLPGLDLYVSSSHIEGFPNAIAEAMACGVPCVATNAGDSEVLVGRGLACDAGDMVCLTTLATRVLDLGPDDRRALGAAARERIVSGFNLAHCVDQYRQLYSGGRSIS